MITWQSTSGVVNDFYLHPLTRNTNVTRDYRVPSANIWKNRCYPAVFRQAVTNIEGFRIHPDDLAIRLVNDMPTE